MDQEYAGKVLAHDALLLALIQTHTDYKKAFAAFSDIYTGTIRSLNKKGGNGPQLANDVRKECARLAAHFGGT